MKFGSVSLVLPKPIPFWQAMRDSHAEVGAAGTESQNPSLQLAAQLVHFLPPLFSSQKKTYLTLQHLLEYFWKKHTHTQMLHFFLGTGTSQIGKRQTAAFLVADIISSESSTGSFTMSRILRPAEPREMEVVRREGSKCDKKGPGWLFGSFFYWRVRRKGDQILVIAIL